MATYTDAKLSNFPDKIDDLPRLSDVSATTVGKMNQYNSLMASGDFVGANEILDDELAKCLFTADTYNKLRDAIIAVERSFKDDVSEIIGVAGNINDSTTDSATKKVTTYSSYKIDNLFNGITIEELGGLQVIDAQSSSYDMDTIIRNASTAIYLTNKNTLNTPFAQYNAGDTTIGNYTRAAILNHSNGSGYGIQIAYRQGAMPTYRTLSNGTLSKWNFGYVRLSGDSTVSGTITATGFKGKLTGNVTGNADTATKLKTARTIQVDLSSTKAVSFDGTANVTPGIKGVLPLTKGGTGFDMSDIPDYAIVRKGADVNYLYYTPTANGAYYATGDNKMAKFGTLPVAQGGTGVTSNPSMLTDLGSTKAANVFAASPKPGVTGVLSAENGGTGQKTLKEAANAFINALEKGTSAPKDTDYFISQYVNGNEESTTATTKNDYYRRPFSYLWNYIKSKADSVYLKLTGGTLTGTLYTSHSIYKSTDDSNIIIGGGSSKSTGGSLYLYGKNSSSYKGSFILKANNGTTYKNLYGTPDGTLNWDGKKVYTQHNVTSGTTDLTANTSKLETGHIYLQYE